MVLEFSRLLRGDFASLNFFSPSVLSLAIAYLRSKVRATKLFAVLIYLSLSLSLALLAP